MREIWVSDHANHLRPYAAIELGAYQFYPEDTPSREQALTLLEMKYMRWTKEGPDEFEFSGIVQKILTDFQKSMGQRLIVGLVGIAMHCLANAGKRVSLEAAAKIVSEYAFTVSKQRFVLLKGRDWIERDLPLTSDPSDIKTIFRSYRSVAHLCAAQVSTADYLVPRSGFDPQPEADACFIATAMYFQNLFRKVKNFDDWNLWEVRFSPPDPTSLSVLLPTHQAIENLMIPWLDLMRQATLNN